MTLDEIWMIVLPQNKGVVYDTIGTSSHETWEKFLSIDCFKHNTQEQLHKDGYRARKVRIVFD
jgi:hypothetical protein